MTFWDWIQVCFVFFVFCFNGAVKQNDAQCEFFILFSFLVHFYFTEEFRLSTGTVEREAGREAGEAGGHGGEGGVSEIKSKEQRKKTYTNRKRKKRKKASGQERKKEDK